MAEPPAGNLDQKRRSIHVPKVDRATVIDSLLEQLLESRSTGKQAQMSEVQLRELCAAARETFLSQSALIEIGAPVTIMGDLHGQFEDLMRHFDKSGYPPETNYLCLGDYVDRGKRSLEVICLMMAYKVKFPENMFLLRGNHECASITRIYGFYDECKRRFNIKLWKTFTDCFNCMPIAAVIENTIYCAHGGLSPDLKDLDLVRKLERPLDVPENGIVCDILWSDPDEDISGWGENDRGVSYTFGGDVVRGFLQRLSLSLIVRAHQVVEDGYQFFARRKLVTLFSAPNYCGEFDNAAAVMHVAEDLMCSFSILPPNKNLIIENEAEKGRKGS